MKRISFIRLCLLSFPLLLLFSCNEKEEFVTEPFSDYIPLVTGKYITYRLDSLVFREFGTVEEVHSYQEKHVVDAAITDNLGRPAYRVFVYQNDVDGLGPWDPVATYAVTVLHDQVEITDDNLRFIKLHGPLRDGYTWKGNKYLSDNPYEALYNFSNDNNMINWDFFYDGGASFFSYEGYDYSDVFTVEQADESYNVPITDPSGYAARTRAVERYAKGIGLVYKEFEMWEYQPSPNPNKKGFGVKLWMIDHN